LLGDLFPVSQRSAMAALVQIAVGAGIGGGQVSVVCVTYDIVGVLLGHRVGDSVGVSACRAMNRKVNAANCSTSGCHKCIWYA
jgi:hypothetical protein